VWSGLLFEGGINSGVPDGNGQTILFSESFDELNLLVAKRCFWRPNVPELVVVHHTVSTHVDSLVNPLAEFLFEVIQSSNWSFSSRIARNLGSQITIAN